MSLAVYHPPVLRSTRPDLAIVIVTYNVRDYLAAFLQSLPAAADGLAVDIVVVDNASCDGSADLVATKFPGVRLIRNRENLGFARAANEGLPRAERAGARFALLLNPDTIVPPRVLIELIATAWACPEAGLVAPMLDAPASGAGSPVKTERHRRRWKRDLSSLAARPALPLPLNLASSCVGRSTFSF